MYKATQEIKFAAFNILFPWQHLVWCGHTIHHSAGMALAIPSSSSKLFIIPVKTTAILHIMMPTYSLWEQQKQIFGIDSSDACKP
jgi:hypothetical protein